MGLLDWLAGRLPDLEQSADDAEKTQQEMERVLERQRKLANRLRALQVEADLIARQGEEQ